MVWGDTGVMKGQPDSNVGSGREVVVGLKPDPKMEGLSRGGRGRQAKWGQTLGTPQGQTRFVGGKPCTLG